MATLDEIRSEIKLRYGVPSNDAFYSNANLTTLINSANRQINLAADWPWMFKDTTVDTVVDTNTLTVPTDTRRVVKMDYQQFEIQYWTERVRPSWWSQTGAPRAYSYEGTNWVIYPKPDQIYTIGVSYVIDKDTVLSQDTDTPLLPDWCIDTLISKVCLMLARRERDLDLERNYYGEYETLLDRMKYEQMKTTEGMLPLRTRVEERANDHYWGYN